MTVSTTASWKRELGTLDRLAVRLVYISRHRRGKWATYLLRLLAVDIPPTVRDRPDLYLLHVGGGHVLHSNVTIGRSVVLTPALWWDVRNSGVHNRRYGGPDRRSRDSWRQLIGDGQGGRTVCRSAKELVLGANSVMTHSTGDWEIWAGLPARKLREPPKMSVTT